VGQDGIVPRPEAAGVYCVPIPAWVEHDPYSSPEASTGDAYIGNGVYRLLQDIQVDLCGSERGWHRRSVHRVLSRAGAEQVAHVTIEYDPAYERAEVHFIRIRRGDDCIEHARPDGFQILRREANLNRLSLDGRLTASLLIPDVRVGDIVETAITLSGDNPALGGKYATLFVFDDVNPWFDTRYRLRRPTQRVIAAKRFNAPPIAETATTDGVEDLRWHDLRPDQRTAEDLVAPWSIQMPALQLSEFAGWDGVVCLFRPLYEGGELPDALAVEIDRLATTYKQPAERAAEWLRFVQRELRYFALALGEGGYVPRKLDVIWSGRFGDCKDATQLYVAGARRLGLDACAALTATALSPGLDRFLPNSNLFDHCIVRLRLDGISYWLDPTMPEQSGRLSVIYQPNTGWALPLAEGTVALEWMGGDEPIHHVNWVDEVQFGPRRESPAKLRRQIELYSWAADVMRHRMANEGTADYTRTMLQSLQSIWPEVTEAEPIVLQDDPPDNCLTVVLSYHVPKCWRPAETGKNLAFDVVDTALPGELSVLNSVARQSDIYLGRPRRLTRRIILIMPKRWAGEGWSHAEHMTGATYTNRFDIEGRTLISSKEFVVDAWSAPASEAVAYNAIAARLNENQLSILARLRFGRIRSPVGILWKVAHKWQVIVFVVFLIITALRLLAAVSR
jgi:transglutaminase-like putative cysteine protease